MARILVIPWPLPSHAIASLDVAATLREAGHDVFYLNIGRDDPRYRAHGFASELVLDDLLPDGLLAVFHRLRGRQLNRYLRKNLPVYLERLQDALEQVVARHQVELAVVDRTIAYGALLLWMHRIPSLLLLTVLPLERRDGVPPLNSGSAPPRTSIDRLLHRVEWALAMARGRRLDRLTGMGSVYRRLARASGFPRHLLGRGPLGYELKIPQIIACEERFEFTADAPAHQTYVGASVDRARREPAFDWEWRVPTTPLAYCALGTRAGVYPHALSFLVRVIKAFEGLPGWQLLLAAGDLLPALERSLGQPPPRHVKVVRDVPQLATLERARIMLTHGGLGSVKECLTFGVPMIVFPGADDQFGNAARVRHHGVGAVGDLARSTPEEIRELVARVSTSADVWARVAAMQRAFLDPTPRTRVVEAAHRLLARAEAKTPTTPHAVTAGPAFGQRPHDHG